VLLAPGFISPESNSLITQFELALGGRGNIKTDHQYMSSKPGVFSAGDANRGQSQIVWAISEGREAARCVDICLMGRSELPSKGGGDLSRV
jgi:glutamate synthase (NADPH/NADH) small chain